MPRIEFADAVAADVDRIVEYLESRSNPEIGRRVQDIVDALGVLEKHPLIGRPVPGGSRELVLGRAGRGYLALYKYVPEIDVVFVLAIRSQREAGYTR
jgi:toxin ParE1/3/4